MTSPLLLEPILDILKVECVDKVDSVESKPCLCEDFLVEELGQRENVDFESDWEFLAYKQIYKLLSTLSTNSTQSTLSTLSTSNYFNLYQEIP